jgi:hypothetical protein
VAAAAEDALGAGAGEKNKQFEDKIDEMLVKEGQGTRFDQTGQTWIANQFDVEVKVTVRNNVCQSEADAVPVKYKLREVTSKVETLTP